eukprot:gene35835-44189_t
MSPERIDGKEYSFPSDVWAFGLSLVTIALGRLPIDTQGGYWTILHHIRDAPPPTLPADIFSADFRDFISLCLKRNPDERSTCAQLLQHPFLKKVVAEDLTYAEDFNRGKNELLSILSAIFAHIKQLKSSVMEALVTQSEIGVDMSVYRRHRLYGDIITLSEVNIFQKVLFGDAHQQQRQSLSTIKEEGASDKGDSSKPVVERMRAPTRPRLTNLAKQLHLPVDKTVDTKLFPMYNRNQKLL